MGQTEYLLKVFTQYEEMIKGKMKNQAFHTAATEIRILALTSLLMEKGIITEKEVQKSYERAFEAMKEADELQGEKKEEFERYLINYLHV